jgi:hypothetical protein
MLTYDDHQMHEAARQVRQEKEKEHLAIVRRAPEEAADWLSNSVSAISSECIGNYRRGGAANCTVELTTDCTKLLKEYSQLPEGSYYCEESYPSCLSPRAIEYWRVARLIIRMIWVDLGNYDISATVDVESNLQDDKWKFIFHMQ